MFDAYRGKWLGQGLLFSGVSICVIEGQASPFEGSLSVAWLSSCDEKPLCGHIMFSNSSLMLEVKAKGEHLNFTFV